MGAGGGGGGGREREGGRRVEWVVARRSAAVGGERGAGRGVATVCARIISFFIAPPASLPAFLPFPAMPCHAPPCIITPLHYTLLHPVRISVVVICFKKKRLELLLLSHELFQFSGQN